MEILTTVPNTPETIVRHILEQRTDWVAIIGPFFAALFGGLIAVGIAYWQMKTQSNGLAKANARMLYGAMVLHKRIVYPFRVMLEEAREDQDIHIVIREFSQSEALTNPTELKDPFLANQLLLPKFLAIAASYQGNIVELRMIIEHHLETYGPGRPIRRPGSEARSSVKPTMLRVADSLLKNMESLRPRVFELTDLSEDPWPSDEVLDKEPAMTNDRE